MTVGLRCYVLFKKALLTVTTAEKPKIKGNDVKVRNGAQFFCLKIKSKI